MLILSKSVAMAKLMFLLTDMCAMDCKSLLHFAILFLKDNTVEEKLIISSLLSKD